VSTGNGTNGNGNGHASLAEALGPFPDARVLLERYGLRAKKSFGQNFLISERALRAIADATVATDEDWIIEIGAGLGTLTARLVERVTAGKVIALEMDPDMLRVLRAELGSVDNLDIEAADALRYDLRMAARWRGESITVCGNLPYHIASQVLFKVVDAREVVRAGVFMLQKEMADRVLASPGTKAYGALGVLIRTYADVSTVIKLGAGAFVPPPKVDSTVIKLVPLPGGVPRVPIADPAHYSKVVHAAFGQRRKTLRAALASWAGSAPEAERLLTQALVASGARAEQIEIDGFASIAQTRRGDGSL
jgi:16S rRNA (adenine1518-N6/adenine1519-N6)-dimethyltransferase